MGHTWHRVYAGIKAQAAQMAQQLQGGQIQTSEMAANETNNPQAGGTLEPGANPTQ